MNLNMEKTAIKYRFRTFYIPKDKSLVIFAIVPVLFAKNKKVYFKYFYCHSFILTSDIEMTLKPTKIKGWYILPVDMQVISHLTYSQRLSFLK